MVEVRIVFALICHLCLVEIMEEATFAAASDAIVEIHDAISADSIATKSIFSFDAKSRSSFRDRLAVESSFISENSLENLDVPQWCIGKFLKDTFRTDEKVLKDIFVLPTCLF